MMPVRYWLLLGGLLVACASAPTPQASTEIGVELPTPQSATTEIRVALPTSYRIPAATVRTPQAIISCPIDSILEFTRKPSPLTPHAREFAERWPDDWAASWSKFGDEIAQESSKSNTYTPRRAMDLKDFIHAGLCSVRDLRTGELTPPITVEVTHDVGRTGGGDRTFKFSDGRTFFWAIDWLP
jgi:hypothetical protein